MKNGFLFLLLIFLICCSNTIFSQDLQQPIGFANGNLITSQNITRQTFQKTDLSTVEFGNRYFVVIQFSTLPDIRMQDMLKQSGIDLYNYLPGKAYLASVKSDFNFSIAGLYNISSINAIQPFYKMDPELVQYKPGADKQNSRQVAVGYYPAVDKVTVIQELQKIGAIVISTKYDAAGIIFIQYDPKVISAVAALPFISSISLQSITDKLLNYNSIGAHGISGLNSINGKNLRGKGVTLGVGDNADISTHTDFTGRLINRSPALPADHGTHTSGTAAGAGIINVKNHGVAPQATIISQSFSDIIVNAPAYVADNNMVVTNNSYYSVDVGCGGNGKYDVLSNYVDAQMKSFPQLMHVVASGNDGTYSCGSFLPGFGTVKSGWQSAKNVLTVGAMRADDYSIAYFSSRGPLKDGRLKPEITAAGWAVMSTNAFDTYGLNYGTSMAAPVLTGTLSLMYERYRQKHGGSDPISALMKALVCNTAQDLGNVGPDYTFGFGMLNAGRAVEAIDSNRYIINSIGNGGNISQVINVPANTRRLKVMLYWADNEAAVNAASALVNDLDLIVTEPSSVVHRPLVLNPAPANVNDPAIEGADHTNNIEQVIINNPPAGNYTINVKGFAVPIGPQEYIISYEIDKPSVVVEYPFGGEKLVPGEIENIRWTALGNEANNFTVEYSGNNGANWSVIDNNVPNTARSLTWTVPAGITNAALTRVSRNGTALTGISNSNFTILGSPDVTAANVCEGAVQLTWGAVTGASSYDVLQLVGDSMQVIGNSTGVSYLVKGLDKNEKTWLGVAAKNGAFSGRRSVSISVIPNSGPCVLASFNNDLKVDTILEPVTARKGYANAANAIKPVKVLIRNLGTVATSGPFTLSFSYNGILVSEAVNTTIAAGGTYTHTFSGAYTILPAGFHYDFKSWITFSADGNHLNDTAYKTVKYINNDPIVSLPLTENFESMQANNFIKNEMAIDDNKFLDFSSSTTRGRARSFVNTGFSHSGAKALTLDQSPRNDTATADTLTLSYNLLNYASKQLRFDFYYKNHGQANAAGNKIWMRGNENNNWIQAYDLFANQAALGDWMHSNININDVLSNALPPQTVSPTFQVRIGEEGNIPANSAHPVVDADDGYTFDDLVLNEAMNDVGMLKINSPDISDCALTAANPISVKIKNYNNVVLNNLPVSYRINAGPIVTEIIPSLTPNQILDYVFTQKANLSAYIDYSISVWIKYPPDSYAPNDSILNFVVHNSPVIRTYPYLQSFENSDGFFYAKGTNNSWEWGAPSKLIIHKAANGNKAWVTSLTKNYKDNETSYLYSPCFDLTGLSQPMLSFSHIFELELKYDYSWVEYSANGIAWQKLGAVGSGTNWFDNVLNNWSVSKTRWHVASVTLPASMSNIRFRFVLSSDGGVTEEGIGIDDIHVFDRSSIYEGAPVTGVTQNVSGGNWVNFSSGGKRIVSLNANGMNLGATTAQVHPYSGAVRSSNNVYYADRNIVIRPANLPTAKTGVRFYFTETEAQNLINATGCIYCVKPIDPYELGATQYSGSIAEENGLVDDDITGLFQYIPPDSVAIIPYDNGYYAEFQVNAFSEFWLSTDNIRPAVNGVCPDETIVFNAVSGATIYQWQEDSGSGFTNISDNFVYEGTSTSSLQLINLPTYFAGYKYRCIADGVAGAINTVRFTNVWNGSVDSNWFVAENWSCGSVPDQFTDVIIPGNISIYPVINMSTAVRRISARAGANITIAAGVNLAIEGK
ncbi:MAG: S8 family serine peptidase [Ferruginibacter sp.]